LGEESWEREAGNRSRAFLRAAVGRIHSRVVRRRTRCVHFDMGIDRPRGFAASMALHCLLAGTRGVIGSALLHVSLRKNSGRQTWLVKRVGGQICAWPSGFVKGLPTRYCALVLGQSQDSALGGQASRLGLPSHSSLGVRRAKVGRWEV